MRTSLSSDLIFKGSASLPALSRASVALTLTQTRRANA
jgi:chromosome segregation ATPase